MDVRVHCGASCGFDHVQLHTKLRYKLSSKDIKENRTLKIWTLTSWGIQIWETCSGKLNEKVEENQRQQWIDGRWEKVKGSITESASGVFRRKGKKEKNG